MQSRRRNLSLWSNQLDQSSRTPQSATINISETSVTAEMQRLAKLKQPLKRNQRVQQSMRRGVPHPRVAHSVSSSKQSMMNLMISSPTLIHPRPPLQTSLLRTLMTTTSGPLSPFPARPRLAQTSWIKASMVTGTMMMTKITCLAQATHTSSQAILMRRTADSLKSSQKASRTERSPSLSKSRGMNRWMTLGPPVRCWQPTEKLRKRSKKTLVNWIGTHLEKRLKRMSMTTSIALWQKTKAMHRAITWSMRQTFKRTKRTLRSWPKKRRISVTARWLKNSRSSWSAKTLAPLAHPVTSQECE